jgi:hypothetical protein
MCERFSGFLPLPCKSGNTIPVPSTPMRAVE